MSVKNRKTMDFQSDVTGDLPPSVTITTCDHKYIMVNRCAVYKVMDETPALVSTLVAGPK